MRWLLAGPVRRRPRQWEHRAGDGLRPPSVGSLRVVFGAIAVMALVLGYIGLAKLPSGDQQGHSLLNLLYHDAQLFVLGSDPLQEHQPNSWQLQLARFAAPICTIYALVDAGRLMAAIEVRRLRTRRARSHVIVCGDTPIADTLSRRLRAAGRHVVEVRSYPEAGEAYPDRGPLRVYGDARFTDALRQAGLARADVLYTVTGDSATNTALALAAKRERAASSGEVLDVYAHIIDPELCLALQARFLGAPHDEPLRLEFFNADDVAARRLLVDEPLRPVGGRPPRVLVVGATGLGQAIVLELARQWRVLGPRNGVALPVTVVGEDAPALMDKLVRRYPLLRRVCAFDTRDSTLLGMLGAGQLREPPDRVFICYADETKALRTAVMADRFWRGRARSVAVRLDQLAAFPDWFGVGGTGGLFEVPSNGARVFSVVETAADPQLIGEDLPQRLGRVCHDRYLAARRHGGEDDGADSSMTDWEALPEEFRESNLELIEDIGRKLRSVGCVLAPRGDLEYDGAFGQADLERLARMEHERWLAARRATGWRYGEVRDDHRKLNPAMRDWQELAEPLRRRTYELVGELPAILADAGFQIIRV